MHKPPAGPVGAPSAIAAFRNALRRDGADRARWTTLADAGERIAAARTPVHALDAVLDAACAMLGAHDAAVLASRSGRWRALAGRGRAMPPGAAVPAPIDPDVVQTAVRPAWLLGAAARATRAVEVPVAGPHGIAGRLGVVTPAPPTADDLRWLGVLAALAAVHVAEPARGPRPDRRVADPRLASLTVRERQVLSLLPRGLSNAALGAELGIAPGTAKTHVERILHKLGLSDRTQAAVYATRHGIAA